MSTVCTFARRHGASSASLNPTRAAWLPFGRGAVVWDLAHYPRGADLPEVTAEWTRRLNAVEARADAITGLERV